VSAYILGKLAALTPSLDAMGIRQSQYSTSRLKDPLSDRVRVAVENPPVSPQNRRVAPLTPIGGHQRLNSRLLFDGQSAHPLLSGTLKPKTRDHCYYCQLVNA
jgi:hypothetical protein